MTDLIALPSGYGHGGHCGCNTKGNDDSVLEDLALLAAGAAAGIALFMAATMGRRRKRRSVDASGDIVDDGDDGGGHVSVVSALADVVNTGKIPLQY